MQTQDLPLSGRRILVVEDVSIIAMELENILFDAGAAVVTVASGVEDGRDLVGPGRFDVAVIGIFLDVSAVELALAIAESGCPIVLIASQPDGLVLSSPLDRARRVGKPYATTELVEAVVSALGQGRDG